MKSIPVYVAVAAFLWLPSATWAKFCSCPKETRTIEIYDGDPKDMMSLVPDNDDDYGVKPIFWTFYPQSSNYWVQCWDGAGRVLTSSAITEKVTKCTVKGNYKRPKGLNCK